MDTLMTLNNKKEEYLIYKLADNMKNCIKIDADLFRKLDVKRGLRNDDGLPKRPSAICFFAFSRISSGTLSLISVAIPYCGKGST